MPQKTFYTPCLLLLIKMLRLKVLIAGGSSFIGKNLVAAVPANWNVVATFYNDSSFHDFVKHSCGNGNVTPYRLNLTDEVDTADFARAFPEFDVILYLAANSDPKKSIPGPGMDLKLNTLGLVMLLERVKCRRLVYISSSAVYLDSLIPYIFSKRASEEYVKFFSEQKGFSYVIIRLFETYGPYSPERKICRKLVQQFDNRDRNVTIYGDGTNLIDHLYIDDTVAALVKIISSDKGNVTVDLCTGQSVPVKELVVRIAKVFGITPKITYEGKAATKIYFAGDPKPMQDIFGISPSISIGEGVMRWQEFKKRNSGKY